MTIPAKAPAPPSGDIIETVIAKGDLSKLTAAERNQYYGAVCKSIGLNPLTRPFEYISLGGKLVLYAKRDAADQLRKINGISIEIVSQEIADGLLTIHVRAKDNTGRQDEDLGVVALSDKVGGEMRANLILKAVTKAKRRVTLSISGLGFLDETEVEDVPGGRAVQAQVTNGNGAPEPITMEQAQALRERIDALKLPIERFYNAMGVESIDEMTVPLLAEATQKLDTYERKQKENAQPQQAP